MLVLVRTDNHVDGSARLTANVEGIINDSLARFSDRLTRVEVNFHDDNGPGKGGGDDMRCVIEARLAGLDPVAVSHSDATLSQARDGAIEKIEKVLDRIYSKNNDHKGRVSFSGDELV
jgi:ribosome-associated translation inhibitor RaiA